MAKEKASLYQEMVFDDYAFAQDVLAESSEKLEKIDKVYKWTFYQLIAFAVFGILALSTNMDLFIAIWAITAYAGIGLAIYSYVKIGGFKVALNWGVNIGKFCWYIIPIFPVDLVVLFMGIIYIPIAMFFIPYLVVRHERKQVLENIEDAEKFLKYHKPVQQA